MSNAHQHGVKSTRIGALGAARRWVESPVAARDRMASLVTQIDAMKLSLLEQERAAAGLCDLTSIERVSYTRANIEIATAALLLEVKAMLSRCSVHADGSLISGCAECIEAAARRGGPAVPTEIQEATPRR